MTISTPPAASDDAAQRARLARVHPPGWRNPAPRPSYDLVVLGAGPAGLTAVECARAQGLSVALVERRALGGNSLNTGSVPSKAIIGATRVFAGLRDAETFGTFVPKGMRVDFPAVMNRMRRIRARIAEYHAADRLRGANADPFFGEARFSGPNEVAVGDARLTFRKAIVATGARSAPSIIPGLAEAGFLTSETVFDLDELPERLAVIGGGPLGCELAQAFQRLGSRVDLIQNDPKFLPREERDAAELLSLSLSRDGVATRLNTTVTGARLEGGVRVLDTVNNAVRATIEADAVLLSVGRVPNVETLRLDAAGIGLGPEGGIAVNDFLRTANPDVYAAGDVCLEHKFTNAAEASARIAFANACAGRDARMSQVIIPWCTFCDPEIAHIGLYVREARARGIPAKSFTIMMQDVDRAIVDGQDDGFVKIHVREGTDLLGATIVASRASEMINEMSVVMNAGLGLRRLAGVLHTYPAQSEAIRQAALACVRDLDGA